MKISRKNEFLEKGRRIDERSNHSQPPPVLEFLTSSNCPKACLKFERHSQEMQASSTSPRRFRQEVTRSLGTVLEFLYYERKPIPFHSTKPFCNYSFPVHDHFIADPIASLGMSLKLSSTHASPTVDNGK